MNLLVTAGNTLVPIDKVRCITNRFTGKTGAAIALEAHARGHSVHLLTSHPAVLAEIQPQEIPNPKSQIPKKTGGFGIWDLGFGISVYQTFDDLQNLMQERLQQGQVDGLIHSAAVSDYTYAGIYASSPGTTFDPLHSTWQTTNDLPTMVDCQAGKVKSDHAELWLRLIRAPKLIDLARTVWGFTGLLVKFKLEVGIDETELLEVAERSRAHSSADLMVANTLETAQDFAYVGSASAGYQKVTRRDLPGLLLQKLESLHSKS